MIIVAALVFKLKLNARDNHFFEKKLLMEIKVAKTKIQILNGLFMYIDQGTNYAN